MGLLPWSLRCRLAASWWWGGKGGVGSGPPSQPAAPSQWPQAEDAGPPAVGFKPPRPTLCPLVQHSVPVPCRLLFYFPPPLPPLGAALLIPLVFAHRWPPDSGGVRGRTVTLFQAGQGWPHCHLEMATPPGAARKGGALTAPSLSGCVSAPSGRRVRRNALPGRAAASAAQPQQRVRSPRRQAAPRAHQGTALQPTGFLPVSP